MILKSVIEVAGVLTVSIRATPATGGSGTTLPLETSSLEEKVIWAMSGALEQRKPEANRI